MEDTGIIGGLGDILYPAIITPVALGVDDLRRFLEERGVEAEIVEAGEAWSSAEAARSMGVSLGDVAKTVVFVGDGEVVLVVLPGDARVDQKRLARLLGYRRLRLARPEEVEAATGYRPGAVPPVGHRGGVSVVVDRALLERRWVYAGGGSERHLLRIRPSDIVALTGARVVDVPRRGGRG